MLGIDIELRPDANHETSMQAVYVVNHLLWVGVAGLVELMASPLVLFPIAPVLHNVVNRNLTVAELLKGADKFVLGLIALTALPESQCPLR